MVAGVDASALPAEGAAREITRALVAHARGERAAHMLVVGRFGLGKSFAVERGVEDAVRQVGEDALRVAAVRVGAAAVATYDDLLYEAARAVAGSEHLAASTAAGALRAAGDRAGLEQLLTGGGPLVLAVDDLDLALAEFRPADTTAFVEFLTRTSRKRGGVVLVGSMSSAVELGFAADVFALRPINAVEVVDLINVHRPTGVKPIVSLSVLLADQRDGVDDLDAATLGNPRFWLIVTSYLDGDRPQAVARGLERWRELLSSYYPDRLASLAPAERRIIVELARAGHPTIVGELAEILGMSNASTASALGRLFAEGWVVRVEPAPGADRRSTWYELADPLLRTYLRRPDQTGASSFVVSAARAWARSRDRVSVAPASASDAHEDRMQTVEAIGSAAREVAAADMARQVLLDDVQTLGLSDERTLEALGEWGRWVGEAGDREGSVEILLRAVVDSEQILGDDHLRTLQIMSHLSWDLIQAGRVAEAGDLLRRLEGRAKRLGKPGLMLWIGARQNLAIVLGEQGDPAAAVRLFEEVLADRRKHFPDDAVWLQRNQHGLAWWAVKAGDPGRAVGIFDELLEGAENESNRFGFLIDRIIAEYEATKDQPGATERAIAAFLDFADMVREYEPDARQEFRAREYALDLAVGSRAVADWPLKHVPPARFAAVVAEQLAQRRLPRADIQSLFTAASEPQLARLAADAVFGGTTLSTDERARLARAIGEQTGAAYGPLLLGFADAVKGDGAALSSLPTEWAAIVSELRATD